MCLAVQFQRARSYGYRVALGRLIFSLEAAPAAVKELLLPRLASEIKELLSQDAVIGGRARKTWL